MNTLRSFDRFGCKSSIPASYSPPQRLWAKKLKIGGKAGEKNEKKYEKRRKPLPDTTPKTRVIRGSTFSNFNLHAYDHYDQNHLTPSS